jgi:MerR family transcriptional regulator, thiopeptide resistance regulator
VLGVTHDEPANLIRVGDLASAAGLTVRALHHYEDIGLLSPSARTAAGHRLYGSGTVERLYRITRLRRLGLSLDQIGHALDDPNWILADALRHQLSTVDTQIAALTSLRAGVAGVLTDVDAATDPTDDLLELITTMSTLDSPLRRRISILVYCDLPAAHAYLTNVFGFTPGDVTFDPDGKAVHAELYAGDGVIWLHPETDTFALASPLTLGKATATMAVMVDDVDEHHQLVKAKGGQIVYGPVDQPYGYREYSARDSEGALWSFMKELDQ